jgi:hypothetical protein
MTTLLPPSILWAAAQFASTDPNKDCLTYIQAKKDADGCISIITTDGHRAFRVILPPCDDYSLSAEEVLIRASAFKKAGGLLKGKVAIFDLAADADLPGLNYAGTCRIIGHKMETLELRPVEVAGKYAPTYPNVPQLWPDTFSCEPGLPIAFNASYVAEFMKVAEKLSPNGVVSMETNSHITPIVYQCYWNDDIKIRYLLMPVQLRSDEFKALESAYKEKQQTKANDSRELAAYRTGQTVSLPRVTV